MEVETGKVKGYGDFEISYRKVNVEKGEGCLAIILPGEGYTAQAPLLHYTAGIMASRGYDVLQVNYQYNHENYQDFSREKLVEAIRIDVNKVIDEVLEKQTYGRYIIIGKSLGTIAMSILLERETFKKAKTVWLTPLIQLDFVYKAIQEDAHEGLCIIGNEDPWYDKGKFDDIKKNSRITGRVIQGANHSLEYADKPLDSIDVLKTVMEDIADFCG